MIKPFNFLAAQRQSTNRISGVMKMIKKWTSQTKTTGKFRYTNSSVARLINFVIKPWHYLSSYVTNYLSKFLKSWYKSLFLKDIKYPIKTTPISREDSLISFYFYRSKLRSIYVSVLTINVTIPRAKCSTELRNQACTSDLWK